MSDLQVRGPLFGGTGTPSPFTSDVSGAQRVSDAHGHWFDSSSRGYMFAAAIGTAGVAPGTAIGTTGALALYNPTSSKVNLVVAKVFIAYLSGTLGAGTFYYVGHQFNATLPGGNALTAQPTLVGATNNSVGKIFSAATGLGVATAIRPFLSVGAMTAESTTPSNPWFATDILDGEFVVPPGNALSIQEVGGAGTTPLIVGGITWEEVQNIS